MRVTVVRTSWMVRTCLRNDGTGWLLVGVLGSPFKRNTKHKDTSKELRPFIHLKTLYFLQAAHKHLVKSFTLPDRLCGPDRSKLVCWDTAFWQTKEIKGENIKITFIFIIYTKIHNNILTLLGGLVVELISTLVCCDMALCRTGVWGLSKGSRASRSRAEDDRPMTRASESAFKAPGFRDTASVTEALLLSDVFFGHLGDSSKSLVMEGLSSWLGCLLGEVEIKASNNGNYTNEIMSWLHVVTVLHFTAHFFN